MGLDPKIWLPRFNFIMQTIAISYPMNPNDVSKKKYYDLIQNIPVFFPDKPLGVQFLKLLDEFPVTPYLSSRMSFMKWVHFIKNKLVVSIGEDTNDFYENLEKYYEEFKPQKIKEKNIYKERKKYIQLSIIAMIVFFIAYTYNK
jgi:hypothetical protein